jgi:hypothetical protein
MIEQTDTLTTLEAAFVESPKDLTLLAAITDYLLDRDDPRGEYLQYIREAVFGAQGAEYRVRGPHVAGLRERDGLSWIGVSPSDVSFVTAPHWYYIWPKSLIIYRIQDDLSARLRPGPFVEALHVETGPEPITSDQLAALFAADWTGRLKQLTFQGCRFSVTTANALGTWATGRTVEVRLGDADTPASVRRVLRRANVKVQSAHGYWN